MNRIRLPEIGDQRWCPRWLRNALTGYLQVVVEQSHPYDVAAPVLASLLRENGAAGFIDLASGAGGPWRRLAKLLEENGVRAPVTLTDVAPNETAAAGLAGHDSIRCHASSVSALDVPAELAGVRTMFTALHHLDRAQVRDVFRSAQRDGVGFAAFEATHRSWRGVALTVLIPLLVLLLMPRVRPRRALVLVLTYLPPVLPLVIWWDGFASTFRTWTASELESIASEVAEPGYTWRVREVRQPGAPLPVLQVVGTPGPVEDARAPGKAARRRGG